MLCLYYLTFWYNVWFPRTVKHFLFWYTSMQGKRFRTKTIAACWNSQLTRREASRVPMTTTLLHYTLLWILFRPENVGSSVSWSFYELRMPINSSGLLLLTFKNPIQITVSSKLERSQLFSYWAFRATQYYFVALINFWFSSCINC